MRRSIKAFAPLFGALGAAWDDAVSGGAGENGRGADLPRTRWGAGGFEIGEIAIHQRRVPKPRRLPFCRQRESRIELAQARHGRPRLVQPVEAYQHGGAHAQAVALVRRAQQAFLEHVLSVLVPPGGVEGLPVDV